MNRVVDGPNKNLNKVIADVIERLKILLDESARLRKSAGTEKEKKIRAREHAA